MIKTFRAVGHFLLRKPGLSSCSGRWWTSAAVQIAASDARIDLILIDVAMPEITGVEAMQAILKKRSGLPFVYMTGYVGPTKLDPSEKRVLKKPFTIAELAATVEELLFSGDAASTGKVIPLYVQRSRARFLSSVRRLDRVPRTFRSRKRAETAQEIHGRRCREQNLARQLRQFGANRGVPANLGSARLRGGAGRTRTREQEIMGLPAEQPSSAEARELIWTASPRWRRTPSGGDGNRAWGQGRPGICR